MLSFHFSLENGSFSKDRKGKITPLFSYAPCSPRRHMEK
jgi:hypothetical protein